MNKRVVTLVCAVMVILTFAAVAFARYDTCDACGGRLVNKGNSDRYNIISTRIKCDIKPGYDDILITYNVDNIWECHNCGDEVRYTRSGSEIICGHAPCAD